MKKIKLKWQKHNRANGMSWNEIAELVDEVANKEREQGEDRHEKLMKVIELLDNPSENIISEEEWLKNGKLLESAKYRFKPNK